jgi:formylglycine-generating enzyme
MHKFNPAIALYYIQMNYANFLQEQLMKRFVPHYLLLLMLLVSSAACAENEMQIIGSFAIDRTEVTIGQFQRYVDTTKTVTAAERVGGGSTFESGWEQRKGWNWRAPFGKSGNLNEPAVHINFSEAQAFCKWAGKRLPTDAEWGEAAYTERRNNPPQGFIKGNVYPYPTGLTPDGANCLGDCGKVKTVPHAITSRGNGHVEVATTKQGVNGLYDMGANVWEWVDSGSGSEKRTRGGSWWYGASSMRDDHVQSKPQETAVIYIGFRCAKTL